MTRAAYRCDLTSGVITSLGFPSSLLSRLGIIDLSPKIGKIVNFQVKGNVPVKPTYSRAFS